MILKNGNVFVDGHFKQMDIEVIDGVITRIAPSIDDLEDCLEDGSDIHDCTGKLILPGMVDIHTHGCLSYDFTVSSTEEIESMLAHYAKEGTTSLLATVMTAPKYVLFEAMERISTFKTPLSKRANIVGIQLEGPFFAPAKKGAHDADCLLPLDIEFMEDLYGESDEMIRLIAVDPTLPTAPDFIEHFSKKMTVSIAHTSCDYNQALEAISCGASLATHLFNAMNGLHHRDPGVIGAFSDTDIYAELICDGFHIHPSVVRLIFKACAERMVLISDSISATGLPDGNYKSGGFDITVKDGQATLPCGTIAGSTISLLDGVRKAIEFGIAPETAILSATLNPAIAVGLDDSIGSLAVGKRGDILILDDTYNLTHVFIKGELV